MADQIIQTSAHRLFPDEASPAGAHIVPLSILDATVGSFAPAEAFWVYDAPTDQRAHAQLRVSLIKTLNAYPQFAGQLQYTQYNPTGDHTSRSRRLQVTYGVPADPGVEFVVADCSAEVAALFPSVEQRKSGLGAFDVSSLGALLLLPEGPDLASHSSGDFTGLPSLIVQVTRFKCGGTVVALRASHPLADAQTLTTFVSDWAAVNRALLANSPLPVLVPIFSPATLDQAASGDIDAAAPDPELLKIADELPIHRYDWWASADGGPDGWDATSIPAHFASLHNTIEFGPPIPWHEWELQAPISNVLLYFSPTELARIWAAAASPASPADRDASSTITNVSRLDTLQAHVWALLMRAHPEVGGADNFHMHLSLGLRERIAPPLPPRTLGSPLVLARASAPRDTPLPALARLLRGTMAAFTPVRVGALLHSLAFDLDSRRMWGGFVGGRQTIATAWVRLGVYEVDFGFGGEGQAGRRPRFVHQVVPAMEGVMQVMEAGPRSDGEGGGPWYRDGASVSLMIATTVYHRMLEDPLLRKYRDPSPP
ncbi:transferase family-domain-containing protein [Mycena galericulata]|nr:transferase family-domain-containing protein [Mycena galericulata]